MDTFHAVFAILLLSWKYLSFQKIDVNIIQIGKKTFILLNSRSLFMQHKLFSVFFFHILFSIVSKRLMFP